MSPRRLTLAAALTAAAVALLAGCASPAAPGGEQVQTLRVGAVTSPMTDIVEAAADEIEDGYAIELVEVADYVTINKMLAAGDIDANFSQHEPYMQEFNAANDASLTAVQPIYNFTIAFYSKTIDDIADLPQGATVAIPNDASNTGRALKMLADAKIITLAEGVDPYEATVDDIAENPKDLQFLELQINQLNTAYDEADLRRVIGEVVDSISPIAFGHIARLSGGNPFHAIQLARSIDPSQTYESAAAIQLPDSLQGAIESRLDNAPDDLIPLLDVLSATGPGPVERFRRYLPDADVDGLITIGESSGYLARDGTHPSDSGREKVARLLLDFFKTDPTAKSWFVESR